MPVRKDWIRGHNSRVRSKETRRKLGKHARERWKNPEYKARVGELISKIMKNMDTNPMQRPELRKKKSIGMKEQWKNPSYRRRTTKSMERSFRSPETRQRRSQITTELWRNPDFRKRILTAQRKTFDTDEWREAATKRAKKLWENPEHRARISQKIKEVWQDPEYRKRTIGKIIRGAHKRPTKPERRLIRIIQEFSLPYRYVGDGSLVIYGLNPDFVQTNGGKRVIEVFGDYWHDEKKREMPWRSTEFGRKAIFSQLGFDCLIIWEKEINRRTNEELRDAIIEFEVGK